MQLDSKRSHVGMWPGGWPSSEYLLDMGLYKAATHRGRQKQWAGWSLVLEEGLGPGQGWRASDWGMGFLQGRNLGSSWEFK